VARHETPLPTVLEVMLKISQNSFAEHVIKVVGAEKAGRGTWEAGLRRAEALLKTLHFKTGSYRLADGSGMSRNNKLTAALVANMLVYADRHRKRLSLKGLLGRPGDVGTMEHRFSGDGYDKKVWAKTGYLWRVGALSGYAKSAGGTDVAFSILINNFRGGGNSAMKQIQERVVKAVGQHAR
jgi:D-alanyl-D-alanine carboxypeptidase/D-alanyl-D-alanine-endopeptidase (penicillin-binding protein 4)